MKPKYAFINLMALTLLFFFYNSACSADPQKGQNSIQIKGSDTMVNLGQAWAEKFMQKNPQSFVAVTGGGSGTGPSPRSS